MVRQHWPYYHLQFILFNAAPVLRETAPTHANDDKVEASPRAREVSPESERDPLEDHFDGEENGEDHVDDLEDEQKLLVVLKVDVLEAKREAEKAVL